MAKPIMISSDSACDLNPQLIAQHGIEITHMYINEGDKTYQDGVDIDPDTIYQVYERQGTLPKTAAIPPEEYLRLFKRYTDQGYEVVHVGLSSGISSTCQHAKLAASELVGVYVVDSEALCAGVGLLVLLASQMRAEHRSAEEIAAALEGLKKSTNTSFIVANLTYLAKGGRCSSATALGANLLGIKPAVEMADGVLSVGKKYRGKEWDCFERFVRDKLDLARETSDGGIAFVVHAGIDPALYAHLVQMTEDSGIFQAVYQGRAGCTISSHCGRETVGFMFQRK